MTEEWHAAAAGLLRAHAGPVLVSGYASELYADLYEAHGWRRVDRAFQANSGSTRVESLWISLTAQALLDQEADEREEALAREAREREAALAIDHLPLFRANGGRVDGEVGDAAYS